MKIKFAEALFLVGIAGLTTGAVLAQQQAQEIKNLKLASPTLSTNGTATLQVEFSSTLSTSLCGVIIDWGNGTRQEIRLGMDSDKNSPLTLKHVYPNPGTYAIKLEGKHLQRGSRAAAACVVTAAPVVVKVTDQVVEKQASDLRETQLVALAEKAKQDLSIQDVALPETELDLNSSNQKPINGSGTLAKIQIDDIGKKASSADEKNSDFSNAVSNLFKSRQQLEDQAPQISNSAQVQSNSSGETLKIVNPPEEVTAARIKFLYSKEQYKEALLLAKKMAASNDVLNRADGLYWLAHIYNRDKSLNNTAVTPIEFLKEAAELNSIDAISVAARTYASIHLVPFHRHWGIKPDNKQSEFFYKKIIDHPFASNQQKKEAGEAIQAISQAREDALHQPAIDYIESPKRMHRLTVVCLDNSDFVTFFIDRPQGPWGQNTLNACRTTPVTVSGDKLRVIRVWYRGSQRTKPSYIVKISAGSSAGFSYVDPP